MLMPDKDVLIPRGRKRWGLYESAVVSATQIRPVRV